MQTFTERKPKGERQGNSSIKHLKGNEDLCLQAYTTLKEKNHPKRENNSGIGRFL